MVAWVLGLCLLVDCCFWALGRFAALVGGFAGCSFACVVDLLGSI